MIEQTDAVVLGARRFSETSKIVKLYTRSLGVVDVMARGAMRPKSRLAGIMQPLGYLNVVIYMREGRTLQNLSSAETVERFPRLVRDLDRIACGMAIIELISASVPEPEPNELLFEGLLRSLRALDNPAIDPRLAELRFMLLLCDLLGYGISFDHCALCEEEFGVVDGMVTFSVAAGSPLCGPHREAAGGMGISEHTLALLLLLSTTKFAHLDGIVCSPENVTEGLTLLTSFLQYHVPGLRRLRVGEVASRLGTGPDGGEG